MSMFLLLNKQHHNLLFSRNEIHKECKQTRLCVLATLRLRSAQHKAVA